MENNIMQYPLKEIKETFKIEQVRVSNEIEKYSEIYWLILHRLISVPILLMLNLHIPSWLHTAFSAIRVYNFLTLSILLSVPIGFALMDYVIINAYKKKIQNFYKKYPDCRNLLKVNKMPSMRRAITFLENLEVELEKQEKIVIEKVEEQIMHQVLLDGVTKDYKALPDLNLSADLVFERQKKIEQLKNMKEIILNSMNYQNVSFHTKEVPYVRIKK